ncbi:hypothetical protein COU96_02815, partial [Candidatus Shapirobacteria bacterium CG10_big_fil_rev_8_21_14_0_10_38_14]
LIETVDYSIAYATGGISFANSQQNHNVNFVYSYDGKVTIATSTPRTVSQIYDYTHAQKEEVFTTFDGTTYTSYLDIQLGTSTNSGFIEQATTKKVNFKAGYGWSAGDPDGSTKNIDSDTWNFIWGAEPTGTFSRQYTYDLTVTNVAGQAVTSTQITLTDYNDEQIFQATTVDDGTIPTQTFTYATYASTTESVLQKVGPFNFKAVKYGFTPVDLTKDWDAKTVESLTLTSDPYVVLSELDALALTGITLTTSTDVKYGEEATTTCSTSCYLKNTPVDQSKFFGIYGWNGTSENTKLVEGTHFTINYGTGVITFITSQSGRTVNFVYSYAGNVTISESHTTSEIYDYLYYKKAKVFTTFDGSTYTSYLDII